MRNKRLAIRIYIAAFAVVVILKLGTPFVAPPALQTARTQSVIAVTPALVAGVAAGLPQ
eukprot:CAMPEP_0172883774 /NCGR_PEP_ID=MMETSP1075-20121228/123479_1 /TAXON_ID=2916 /ORGANISM="Ceratium fusus, Strain PA161109" /LENGTH=58 /DNA_ID=CAMNT_0013736735 /DNA_START=56 /DNA_END=229 /DNA_ORIENTATION=+